MKFTKIEFMQWQRKILQRFFPFIASHRKQLYFLSALNLLMTIISAGLVWQIGLAITHLSSGQFTRLNHNLWVIAIIVLLNQVLRNVFAFHMQRIKLLFVDKVRSHLFAHILGLNEKVLHHYKKGDLLQRLINDVDSLLVFVVDFPMNLFLNLSILIVYATIVIWIDWRLSLLALAMAPLFYLSQRFIAPKTGFAAKQFTEERASLVALEEQSLSNLRGISAFNAEQRVSEDHHRQFQIARKWALVLRRIRVLYNSIFTLMLYLAGVAVIFSGVYAIQAGKLQIGALLSFLIYVRALAGPVNAFANMPIHHQATRPAANRVMEVLDLQADVREMNDALCISKEPGSVRVENICFRYPGQPRNLFDNLSFSITSGETVALVGPSGAGKSTLAGLLLRFNDPLTGTIYINDVDIRTVSLRSLRDTISIVWQHPFLISATVRENLQLAKPNAAEREMEAACRASHAWEFIVKLDKGLDTAIGVNGIKLSAGQTQRLAIAQAFLRDTSILIMDEASSDLDSYSEKMIVEALSTLRRQRSSLIIAHRYSSIRSADRILYLSGEGTIVSGSHDHLMQTQPEYHEAVNWQTRPFEQNGL